MATNPNENPELIENFCSDGTKDEIPEFLKVSGYTPENPNPNGYVLNKIFNQIFQQLNHQKEKGFAFWESTKNYTNATNNIDIVRRNNKIYYAKTNNTNKTPENNPNDWGLMFDFDNPNGNQNINFKANIIETDEGLTHTDKSQYILRTSGTWGIYWDTSTNSYKFRGGGADAVIMDLDEKSINVLNFIKEAGVKLVDKYLGKTAKATDSDKLDGLNSSDFIRNTGNWKGSHADMERVAGMTFGGGEVWFGFKDGKGNVIVDGDYYANEGNSKLFHNNNTKFYSGVIRAEQSGNVGYISPPSGYSIGHLKAVIVSIHAMYFNGTVNSDDSMYCHVQSSNDNGKIKVLCKNSEQRANAYFNFMTIWSK